MLNTLPSINMEPDVRAGLDHLLFKETISLHARFCELLGGYLSLQDIRKKLKAENLLHSRWDLDRVIRRQESEARLRGRNSLGREGGTLI